MSKIVLKKNQYKNVPSFKHNNIFGYYCFGKFNNKDYFEICTSSKDENEGNVHHYRQVIDIDKEEAIKLIGLLKKYFEI